MRATAIQGFVRRLLTHEAAGRQDEDALLAAVERISDKLRVHLSNRIGQEGVRTLLARALTLTTTQFPRLSTARVEADGSLAGLRGAISPGSHEPGDKEPQRETIEGAVAFVAHFLALLVTFIGADLTLRILSVVWPELTFDDATGWETETP